MNFIVTLAQSDTLLTIENAYRIVTMVTTFRMMNAYNVINSAKLVQMELNVHHVHLHYTWRTILVQGHVQQVTLEMRSTMNVIPVLRDVKFVKIKYSVINVCLIMPNLKENALMNVIQDIMWRINIVGNVIYIVIPVMDQLFMIVYYVKMVYLNINQCVQRLVQKQQSK